MDFAKVVEPVFAGRCYKCHGEKKGLGELRMHTTELMKELEEIGLVVAGDPESSELYNRLTLPDDDPLRMPKGGKRLTDEQVQSVRLWIEQGAILTSAEAVPEAEMAEAEPAEAEAEPAPAPASAEAIAALQAAGASVVPLYAGSPLLSIGFPSGPGEVTDETLTLVQAVAPNVAWLDLGRTKVTDDGVRGLATLINLSRLHLENTAVTDAAMGSIAGLKRLEYLNLYGSKVGNPGLAELAALPKLSRLYVWQTGVTFEAAKKIQADKPGLIVNLGWNHPGVVRERLTGELERVVGERTTAEQQATAAEKQLAEAKQKLEAASAREKELNAELEALKNAQ
ncbi:MAG: c-type cytochrome domain-containing protein [Planctomycetota bacterium]